MVKKAQYLEDVDSSYNQEDYFGILDLFFEQDERILEKHHIDSYNQFIEEIIPSILQQNSNIIFEKISEKKIIRHRLSFDNLGIKPPTIDGTNDPMFPIFAHQNNLIYAGKYIADVTQWQDIIDIETNETETIKIGEEKEVPIGKIPIMIGSKFCNLVLHPEKRGNHCEYDCGGYFMINGNEKVVISVESVISRTPLVHISKEQNANNIYEVTVYSRVDTQFVGNSNVFKIRMKKNNTITINVPYMKEISVFTLLRGLGLESDEDIVNAILDPSKDKTILNQLSICLGVHNSQQINGKYINSRQQSLEYLADCIKTPKSYSTTDPELMRHEKQVHLNKIFTQSIIPHITSGTNDPEIDKIYKAYYIAYMVKKLIKCYATETKITDDLRGCDDRDSMFNKRIETPGILLGQLFEQCFKKMLNECNKHFRQKMGGQDDMKAISVISYIKPNIIENGLRQALSTGDFGSKSRKGLSQMLGRMNNLRSESYMRRVQTPTVDASTNKMTSPRHLHNTQYGSLCPMETPEGAKTGIVKNLALTATITVNLNAQIPIIRKFLEGKIFSLDAVKPKQLHSYFKVFLNKGWLGMTDKIMEIHGTMRKMRFSGEIDRMVSLVINYREKEFHIYTDSGRLIRPYLTVTDNVLNYKPEMLNGVKTWNELIAKNPNIIEYVDKEEEQNIMLAIWPSDITKNFNIMNKKPLKNKEDIAKLNMTNRYDGNVFCRYTHCEIHPTAILGVVSSNTPFTNHNHTPRGIFQYSQAGHAIGTYLSDYRMRFDISCILYHPQVPLITTRCSKYTKTLNLPSGENLMVLIGSYMGYNQEDSVIINKSAVERGMMRAMSLNKKNELIKKNPASSQIGMFMKPDSNKVDGMKVANYEKLSEEGYAKVETIIKDGDIIIGIVTPKTTTNEDEKQYRDNSIIYKSTVSGTVDYVITGNNNDGYPLIKMRIRSEKIPMVGDKFCSRHAQKGTVGLNPHRSDLPFTASGLVPDIIINPNCIPSRMTIGQLIETFMGKVCAIKGLYGDGTPFNKIDYHKINDELVASGFLPWGMEVMYNGYTGQKMEMPMFFGPVYYLRLKQMVADKVHSRAGGVNQLLTRQPTEGRSKDGGLRFGEMERDAMSAHGTAQFLKERMVDCSDIYTCHVCDICGLFAHKAPMKKHYICDTCKNTTHISRINIPYVFKLFHQELASINILARIRTSKTIKTPKG
jgi:DNA-directed RNA polymerase II subunit RPB2